MRKTLADYPFVPEVIPDVLIQADRKAGLCPILSLTRALPWGIVNVFVEIIPAPVSCGYEVRAKVHASTGAVWRVPEQSEVLAALTAVGRGRWNVYWIAKEGLIHAYQPATPEDVDTIKAFLGKESTNVSAQS